MPDRLSLALPVDIARGFFDSTVTQAQIDADTFQNSGDDPDLMASWIEDAEDEFRQRTDEDFRIGRVGVAGQRETYEHATYELSGHKAYRQDFSHHTFDYDYSEVTIRLDNDRVLPFDSAAGDEVYVYRGLGGDGLAQSPWEDITDDEDEIWAVRNHPDGELAIHPLMLHRALMNRYGRLPGGGQRLQKLRLAVSYRYGALGGDRDRATRTALSASLTDSQTGTVAVDDGARFPTGTDAGSIIVLVDREYMSVVPDPGNDEMDIIERGVRGTTAAAHDSGDSVKYTPPAIRKAVAARAGMQLVSADRYRQFLPDTESDMDAGQVQDEMESVWAATVEAMS
jgi:hypothetical protein